MGDAEQTETIAASEEGECFVICPIGAEGSPEREHSDTVFKYLIAPGLQGTGFTPARAVELDEPNRITSRVLRHIRDDGLAIADLTFLNPNVMYELAIRFTWNRPVILMALEGTAIPFDFKDQQVVFFSFEPAVVERTKVRIKNQADAALAGHFDNPLSDFADIEILRSGNVLESTVSRLAEEVSSLRERIIAYAGNRDPAMVSSLYSLPSLAEMGDARALEHVAAIESPEAALKVWISMRNAGSHVSFPASINVMLDANSIRRHVQPPDIDPGDLRAGRSDLEAQRCLCS